MKASLVQVAFYLILILVGLKQFKVMAVYSERDIKDLPQRKRVNFINSLSGFKSANLLGTANRDAQSNLAIISSAIHLGADPALLGYINRPASVERHSLENILDVGFYTLNHVNTSIIDAAHQTSARYPKEESEFAATGLDEQWHDGFDAPFVKQSLIQIGLRYAEHYTLLNNTVMVVGEIVLVAVPDEVIHEDGLVDIVQCNSVAVSGLDTYHAPQKVKRLAYAKPDLPSREI
ncbi:MAG: flavin reductase [Pseudomonadota bacterium]